MESNIINENSNRTDKIVFLIAIIMFAFFPFSRNGQIYQSLYVFKNLFTIIFVFFYGVKRGHINLKQLIFVSSIHVILFFFTFTAVALSNTSLKFDYASYSVIIPLSILLIFKFEDSIYVKEAEKIFNVLNVIFILWSLGIIFDNELIKTFTYNNYSQFADFTLSNMMSLNKPVLSFGTHSISSFMTFMISMLNYVAIKIKKDQKNISHYIYIYFYLFINIMTFSNTSFLVSFVILFMLFKPSKRVLKTFGMIIILVTIVVIVVNSGILDQYLDRLFNRVNNGFLARYSSDLYSKNFEFIMNYGGLGLMSDINGDLFLVDSGILVLFSRGNIILVGLFYYSLYNFIKINIDKSYRYLVFFPFLIFEFAASLLILDIRPIFLLLFSIIYMKTISQKPNNASNGSTA